MLVKVGSAVAETTEVLTAGSGGVAKKTLLKTADELPDLSTGKPLKNGLDSGDSKTTNAKFDNADKKSGEQNSGTQASASESKFDNAGENKFDNKLENAGENKIVKTTNVVKVGGIDIDKFYSSGSIANVEKVVEVLKNAGYEINIRSSVKVGSSAVIIEIKNAGKGKNITQVQISNEPRRHAGTPYIKFSTSDQGTIKIIEGSEATYKTDGKEKAILKFTKD